MFNFSCSVSELPKASKQCVCDENSVSVKCTDDGNEYSEGDIFGAEENSPKCEYLRKDHIRFNKALGLIDGKDRINPNSVFGRRFEFNLKA